MANRPILHQAIVANDERPEDHRSRLRWLEECGKKQVRVYGQGVTFRTGSELTFADWNLFDESKAWQKVTLGDARGAQGQDARSRAAGGPGKPSGTLASGLSSSSWVPWRALEVEEVGRRDFEHYIGQNIGQIAEQEGKHVIDALLDISGRGQYADRVLRPGRGETILNTWQR